MAAKDVLSPVPNAKLNPAVERQMELSWLPRTGCLLCLMPNQTMWSKDKWSCHGG
jgi:hypothetical protein